MAHANAALTPRARLRLARLIVEDGWPVARAAERFHVSWPTAKRWADRYRADGRGRHGRPLLPPAPQPRRTPPGGPQDRASALAATAGAGRDRAPGSRCQPPPCTRCWSAAGSTGSAHIDRPPASRSAATSTTTPASLLHVDVKKLGNIPDGGGWRYVGRAQGEQNRAADPAASRKSSAPQPADRPRVRAHRARRPLPGRLRRDPRRRDRRHRHRRAAPRGGLVRRPRRHRRTGAVRQRLRLPLPRLARRLRRARIAHKRTRPYRPQTNGKICEDLSMALHRPGLTPAKV